MIWAAILNLCGAIFGIMMLANSDQSGFGGGYSLCLGSAHYLFLVIQIYVPDAVVGNILIVLIAAIFSALLIVFASFSMKVNIVWIIISFVFYFIDSIISIFSFLDTGFANYCVAMFCHIVILFFAFLCLYSYYSVISIEKRFKNVKVVKGKIIKEGEEVDEQHKYDFLEK